MASLRNQAERRFLSGYTKIWIDGFFHQGNLIRDSKAGTMSILEAESLPFHDAFTKYISRLSYILNKSACSQKTLLLYSEATALQLYNQASPDAYLDYCQNLERTREKLFSLS